MNLQTVFAITVVGHVAFAAGIVTHARVTRRDAGRWPLLALAFGVIGVAGYVWAGR